jgi:anti-sigma regulatory factor (Ser/Thr protein kinase)
MTFPIVSVNVQREPDLVSVRQRARRIAELAGFDRQEQTRIATAASEIARNALKYAGSGRVEFSIQGTRPQMLAIAITDSGPGIERVDDILAASVSSTGMGLGSSASAADGRFNRHLLRHPVHMAKVAPAGTT